MRLYVKSMRNYLVKIRSCGYMRLEYKIRTNIEKNVYYVKKFVKEKNVIFK